MTHRGGFMGNSVSRKSYGYSKTYDFLNFATGMKPSSQGIITENGIVGYEYKRKLTEYGYGDVRAAVDRFTHDVTAKNLKNWFMVAATVNTVQVTPKDNIAINMTMYDGSERVVEVGRDVVNGDFTRLTAINNLASTVALGSPSQNLINGAYAMIVPSQTINRKLGFSPSDDPVMVATAIYAQTFDVPLADVQVLPNKGGVVVTDKQNRGYVAGTALPDAYQIDKNNPLWLWGIESIGAISDRESRIVYSEDGLLLKGAVAELFDAQAGKDGRAVLDQLAAQGVKASRVTDLQRFFVNFAINQKANVLTYAGLIAGGYWDRFKKTAGSLFSVQNHEALSGIRTALLD